MQFSHNIWYFGRPQPSCTSSDFHALHNRQRDSCVRIAFASSSHLYFRQACAFRTRSHRPRTLEQQNSHAMAGAAPEAAQVVANLLGKLAKYAAGLGIGISALQTSLYTGASSGGLRCPVRWPVILCALCILDIVCTIKTLFHRWGPHASAVSMGRRCQHCGALAWSLTANRHFASPSSAAWHLRSLYCGFISRR